MNKIKKLMITLVALLAVTTGAWADVTWSLSGSTLTVSGTGAMADYVEYYETPWYDDNHNEIKTIIIESGVTSIGANAFARLENLESVSIPASVTSIGNSAFLNCGSDVDALTVSFAEGSTPLTISAGAFENANLKSIDIPNRVTSIDGYAFYGCNNLESVSIPASVTSIGNSAFSNCGKLANVYIYATSLTTYGNKAFDGNATGRKIYVLSDAVDTYKAGWSAYAADIEAIPGSAASSGPEVAWTAASKTGKFTMPGGNVTLEPEYYPQATAAEGAVTAATDAKATTDAPLVTIDETKLTGATKMMYYVSTDATAPAYDAEGWTDVLPTAEKFTEAANLNVWYYPVGTDEGVGEATATYSDGDIVALQVTLGAAPLWNAEFDLTNAPEEDKAGKWSTDIPEGGVVKGQTVTVTYTGTKKVIGVKAEKKAAKPAAEGHALSASVVGEIVGSDGNVYAVADKDNLPEGVTAVAMVAYKSATAGSSLAIALADEGSMNWNSAKSTCASKAAIGGKSWKLPTKDEWEQLFSANGGSTGLKTALSAAGGASSTLQNGYYWSSTEVVLDPEDDPDMAWIYSFGEVRWYWDDMVNGRQVRACLAF